MVEHRIKPHLEAVAEIERRAALRLKFRRNQALGMLMIAALILLWRLFHTHLDWLFRPGWWRL